MKEVAEHTMIGLTAKPYNWKFTAADLTDLLPRIGGHQQPAPTRQTDLATAA
jgi:hypothetical protein